MLTQHDGQLLSPTGKSNARLRLVVGIHLRRVGAGDAEVVRRVAGRVAGMRVDAEVHDPLLSGTPSGGWDRGYIVLWLMPVSLKKNQQS